MRVLPKISETSDDVTVPLRDGSQGHLLFLLAIPFNINLQEDFQIISDFCGGHCVGTIDIWKDSEGFEKKIPFSLRRKISQTKGGLGYFNNGMARSSYFWH